jgi:hypothetical protein
LFGREYGIPFTSEEKTIVNQRDRKEKESKNFKKPFTFNRIHESSVFSPPVTSFMKNMKSDFKAVFIK